jgi:hypothetical protein
VRIRSANLSGYFTLAKRPRNALVKLNDSGTHRHTPALVIYVVVICCLSTYANALVELKPALLFLIPELLAGAEPVELLLTLF